MKVRDWDRTDDGPKRIYVKTVGEAKFIVTLHSTRAAKEFGEAVRGEYTVEGMSEKVPLIGPADETILRHLDNRITGFVAKEMRQTMKNEPVFKHPSRRARTAFSDNPYVILGKDAKKAQNEFYKNRNKTV